MAEMWELVDINMKKTGALYERGCNRSLPKGMYHVGGEIWVKNKKGQLLLTLRHPQKTSGNMWECTAGSYIEGENYTEGAARELMEEIGIKADIKDLHLMGRRVRRSIIVETYIYCLDSDDAQLSLQPEEVVDAKWVDIDDIKAHPNMVRNIKESFVLYEHILRAK